MTASLPVQPPPDACTAAGRGCGTPTGWRNGGRCSQCRQAHNTDTNQRRGVGALTDTERQIVLGALRQGRTPDEVAPLVDRSVASLVRQVRSDSELRLAAEGASAPAQRVARMGDYLAALTRHNGIMDRAAKEVGVVNSLVGWRKDPAFAAAETAVKALAHDPTIPARGRLTGDMLDRAAEVLESGATIKDAAAAIGCSGTALYQAAARHPRLAAAFPPVQRRSSKSGLGRPSPRKRTPDREEQLKGMWHDPSLTIADIAQRLEVSVTTVQDWSRSLKLPSRRRVARKRQHQRDRLTPQPDGAHVPE